MANTQKYALVLSGGGFRGAFQAGALQVLQEQWQAITGRDGPMQFDLIAGVSVGALNGAMTAMNKPEVLQKLWQDVAEHGVEVIYTSDFIDTQDRTGELQIDVDLHTLLQHFLPGIKLNLGRILGLVFSGKKREELNRALRRGIGSFRAIADNTPLRNLLEAHLERSAVAPGDFYCGFVSLDSGQFYAHSQRDFRSDEAFVNGVLASTVMPIVWEPVSDVQLQDRAIFQNVDGGLKNVSPLGNLIQIINRSSEPDEVYTLFILNCSSGQLGLKRMGSSNVVEIAMRALVDIVLDEIFENDLREFLRINDLLLQLEEAGLDVRLRDYDFRSKSRGAFLRPFRSVLIQPDAGILGDSLTAGQGATELRIQHGRVKALQAVQAMLNEPPSPYKCIVA